MTTRSFATNILRKSNKGSVKTGNVRPTGPLSIISFPPLPFRRPLADISHSEDLWWTHAELDFTDRVSCVIRQRLTTWVGISSFIITCSLADPIISDAKLVLMGHGWIIPRPLFQLTLEPGTPFNQL
jgi:hypothetical protein